MFSNANQCLTHSFASVKHFYLILYRPSLRICWTMRSKDEQIGFRLPANLKRELHNIARREGRTLSQICEIFVSGGLESYRREGPKYLQRLLSRQKKEEFAE
jgi:hypothetical protein